LRFFIHSRYRSLLKKNILSVGLLGNSNTTFLPVKEAADCSICRQKIKRPSEQFTEQGLRYIYGEKALTREVQAYLDAVIGISVGATKNFQM
jgi:hypothetical protein